MPSVGSTLLFSLVSPLVFGVPAVNGFGQLALLVEN